MSPNSMGRALGCQGYTTYSDFKDKTAQLRLTKCTRDDPEVRFNLHLICGLLFTDSMIAPTPVEHTATCLPAGKTKNSDKLFNVSAIDCCPQCVEQHKEVKGLTAQQNGLLWHFCLGHTNQRAVSDLHKYADGIPKNLPRGDPLHLCAICKRAKLHKASRGSLVDEEPSECWQDIQIDVGFFVQASSGKKAPAKWTPRKSLVKPRMRPRNSVLLPKVPDVNYF